MRFAAVQFEIAWEDKAANHTTIEHMLAQAQPRLAPGSFVLLPELGDTGFSMNLDRIVDDQSLEWAMRLARSHGVFVQHGFARRDRTGDNRGRNCAVIIDPSGRMLADYEKVHPFSYGREAEHYSGGDHVSIAACGDACVCPLICYDLRFPELWRLAALHQPAAEVFTIGASWPSARQHHWRSLCIARAIENQAFVVACNRCGSDPHLTYAGGSLMVSPTGEILAEASNAPVLLQAEITPMIARQWRSDFPALQDAHMRLLGHTRIDTTLR